MNVVKKDPRKFSAFNIQLKVVIEKRLSVIVFHVSKETYQINLRQNVTLKGLWRNHLNHHGGHRQWHKLPKASTRSENSTIDMTQKRVRRYAESHSVPRVSGTDSVLKTWFWLREGNKQKISYFGVVKFLVAKKDALCLFNIKSLNTSFKTIWYKR